MVGDWEQKRPIWILYILSSLTEENIRLRKIPLLDQFMDNAAEGLGKTVQAVETPRDQCRPLNRLSNQQVRKNNNNCYTTERLMLQENAGTSVWCTFTKSTSCVLHDLCDLYHALLHIKSSLNNNIIISS